MHLLWASTWTMLAYLVGGSENLPMIFILSFFISFIPDLVRSEAGNDEEE